jgi:hypothetical protein
VDGGAPPEVVVMRSSCMGKELPKEKKWGIRNCRERKCPELRKNGNTDYPEDEQERCQVFGTMPGTLPCCIKDPAMPPEELLRHAVWNLHEEWETHLQFNRKTPGPKNCPATCPYKISEIGKVFGSSKNGYKEKQGTIWKCAFTGAVLGSGLAASCPCHVLDNPEQDRQIETIQQAILHRFGSPFNRAACDVVGCPDGIIRCKAGDIICPVIQLPFIEIKECPLWRIPAKLLPAPASPPAQEPVCTPSPAPKPKKVAEEKPAPEKKSRKKKEPVDPICEACRERFKKPVPDYACEGCKEDQKTKGRRAWTTELSLQTVHLGDMEKLGEQIPDESVDLIFTDPPYVKEQYEEAYDHLARLACRVLKPNGFLITYAPQTHLDQIMDFLRYSGQNYYHGTANLRYFWIISSLNEGKSTAKNHQRNAICLHKPILVFQKAPEDTDLKGSRRCFADVVRGRRQKKFHPWQQSIHDVLGIISRFMVPGEILLDPYAGTGTSLIAANLLGMDWIGFEIDPKTHAIAVRELQQQPMDLQAFGIEADAAECKREPAPEQKDTSKQAAIETAEISSKKRSRIDKPDPGIKKELTPLGKIADDVLESLLHPEACKVVKQDCRTPMQKAADAAHILRDPATEARPVELHAACLDCEGRDDCRTHDPKAGCLDTVKAIQEAQKERDHGTGGGPQPFVQHCCGTCGHHKGRKTFHETCPRLGELLFKGGTQSAKVLMEETQREQCEVWISKAERIPNITWCSTIRNCPALDWGSGICTTTGKKLVNQNYCPTQHLIGKPPAKPDPHEKNVAAMGLKKDTPEWFTALTESKRRSCPGWYWEVWKIDPKKKGEWLYEGARTEKEANALKKQLESDEFHKGSMFKVRKRPSVLNYWDTACNGCSIRVNCKHLGTVEGDCCVPIPEKKKSASKKSKKGSETP